ncbi:MAG: hypothetical protein AAGI06_02040 [Pseudomonadota bacterium]
MSSAGSSDSTGKSGGDEEEQIVQLIDRATALAEAGNHTFLAYLLGMARIEAHELVAKAKR